MIEFLNILKYIFIDLKKKTTRENWKNMVSVMLVFLLLLLFLLLLIV